MKILITYGTRPLAQRLVRLLGNQHEIVLATCEEVPAVLKNFHPVPNAKNPTYAHEVLKLCLDLGVECVLPMAIEEIRCLHEARVLFEEYGISVLVPAELGDTVLVASPSASQPLFLFTADRLLFSEGEDALVEKRVGLYTPHEGGWYLVTL